MDGMESTSPPITRVPPYPARAGRGQRVFAAVLGSLALALLVIASRLTAAPAGVGTHTQLGMPPCGMMIATGYPCPTCGMTTAFTAAAHASPWSALRAQP